MSNLASQNSKEASKSPIVEYLKQVEADKLPPHFLPFKYLKEYQAFAGSGGIGLKLQLDSICISNLKAPSIASAIKNTPGLKCMSLVDCRLVEEAFTTILSSAPLTLFSLNLSQNEFLTATNYRALHKFSLLTHLTLENCNIGDKVLAILLDLDPLKLNQDNDQTKKLAPIKEINKAKKIQFS